MPSTAVGIFLSSHVFSRASRMLRGATQPVSMPCVCQSVCLSVCVEIFFPTNPYLQAGLTDLDEIWHDRRTYGVASPKTFW